ncbi:MAG: type II toxin-antitoxin system VapC family toxin [Deltaproteobacteria bacterium]|nr:type II toxin-antitoxin system VapC family toxin [Deltaproteobacteria bacterium]
MILIDSSAWIAYFLESPSASAIDQYLKKEEQFVLPTIVLYEVYRHLTAKLGSEKALFYVDQMQHGDVRPLDAELALNAAELSHQYKLGTADAIVYATALSQQAKIITLDNDFRNLPGCTVIQ